MDPAAEVVPLQLFATLSRGLATIAKGLIPEQLKMGKELAVTATHGIGSVGRQGSLSIGPVLSHITSIPLTLRIPTTMADPELAVSPIYYKHPSATSPTVHLYKDCTTLAPLRVPSRNLLKVSVDERKKFDFPICTTCIRRDKREDVNDILQKFFEEQVTDHTELNMNELHVLLAQKWGLSISPMTKREREDFQTLQRSGNLHLWKREFTRAPKKPDEVKDGANNKLSPDNIAAPSRGQAKKNKGK